MRRFISAWSAWLCLALGLILPEAAQSQGLAASYTEDLEISGNVAVPTEVYLSLLELAKPGKKASGLREKGRAVQQFLEQFLRGAGYDLATVQAYVAGERIHLEIDEGRLDKIIFVGEGGLRSLQLRLQVDLPGRVYNRPLLERSLRLVSDRDRVVTTRYRVMPVAEPSGGERLQLADPSLLGLPILRPGEPHELRIYFEYARRKPGFDVALNLGPPDSMAGTTWIRFYDVFWKDDRLELVARIGVRPIQLGRDSIDRRGLTRARLAAEWHSPPLLRDLIFLTLSTEIDMVGRDRQDLGLNRFYYAPIRGSAGVGFRLVDPLTLELGIGAEQRLLFGFDRTAAVAPLVEAQSGNILRVFASARAAYRFNTEEIRRDRAHRVALEGRLYPGGSGSIPAVPVLSADWELTVPMDWDELRFDLHASWLGSGAPFYQQVAMADGHLRMVFSRHYTLRAASLSMEYRLSLVRDLLKASAFNELVVMSELPPDQSKARVIDSFGLGLHLLLVDTFQVNGYVGPGFSSRAPTADFGLLLTVLQAF